MLVYILKGMQFFYIEISPRTLRIHYRLSKIYGPKNQGASNGPCLPSSPTTISSTSFHPFPIYSKIHGCFFRASSSSSGVILGKLRMILISSADFPTNSVLTLRQAMSSRGWISM